MDLLVRFPFENVMHVSHGVLPEERGWASVEESDERKNLINSPCIIALRDTRQDCRISIQICQRVEGVRDTFTANSFSTHVGKGLSPSRWTLRTVSQLSERPVFGEHH